MLVRERQLNPVAKQMVLTRTTLKVCAVDTRGVEAIDSQSLSMVSSSGDVRIYCTDEAHKFLSIMVEVPGSVDIQSPLISAKRRQGKTNAKAVTVA